jgi:hypothetical protein
LISAKYNEDSSGFEMKVEVFTFVFVYTTCDFIVLVSREVSSAKVINRAISRGSRSFSFVLVKLNQNIKVSRQHIPVCMEHALVYVQHVEVSRQIIKG